jgi:hypothetical protein
MTINYGSVRPGLERARTAWAERVEEVIRRELAELSELHLTQRTIRVKRLQQRIGHENIEVRIPRYNPDSALGVRPMLVEPSLHSSFRNRMAYGAAFENSLLAALCLRGYAYALADARNCCRP